MENSSEKHPKSAEGSPQTPEGGFEIKPLTTKGIKVIEKGKSFCCECKAKNPITSKNS